MPANKPAPKRKRRVPAPAGAKTKQTVAAKKKHVRELAKNGQWCEIERLYGKTILAKAKTCRVQTLIYSRRLASDVETQRVKKTPLEIAHEILIKNGYMASTSQTAVNAGTSTSHETESNTKAQQNISNSHSSATVLTEEQQKMIEAKRQEALARRRRKQQTGRHDVRPPVIIQPDPTEEKCGHLRQARAPLQGHHVDPQTSPVESCRPNHVLRTSNTHRAVTPENNSTTTEPARPDCFWDDLEAAAEIIQWENEHMAKVTLEQGSSKTASGLDREATDNLRGQTVSLKETKPSGLSDVPSLSQELAAAAEIIEWEQEHEVCSEVPAASVRHSDNKLDTPHFQLLPVQITDNLGKHDKERAEPVRTRVDTKYRHEGNFSPPNKHPTETTPSRRHRFSRPSFVLQN
ncbi:hypothetical protein PsorP6_002018 [Peronosclerospora sorghi]|uniref:Uncharacterized protein n=1 Tax=Peronosclerospora sorghi TaxID=230839 RepID=A0ACC0WWD5_9STRA|nr:hypothetical protein PsorP6_002018 [Peronosclerospora sorghi]